MGFLYFIFSTIARSIDVVCVLLDLNFWLVHSLVRLLLSLLSFVNSLPGLVGKAVAGCWNAALLGALDVGTAVFSGARSALVVMEGWVSVLSGVLDNAKVTGHVLLQVKERMLQMSLSAPWVLWQLCEAGTVTLSVVWCMLHSAACRLQLLVQSICSATLALWEAAVDTLLYALHLPLALVWAPCCLTLQLLGSVAYSFVTVFLMDLYGLVFTVAVVAAVLLYMKPVPAGQALQYIRSSTALQRLQGALICLQVLALECTQAVAELHVRQRVAWWSSYIHRRRGGTLGWFARHLVADRERAGYTGLQGVPAPNMDVTPPCHTVDTTVMSVSSRSGVPVESLLERLREQEERKLCVICQDSVKTVLLLPCRHLCLCLGCTQLLLRLPAYQHNCPLCRHMILQTVDVYT